LLNLQKSKNSPNGGGIGDLCGGGGGGYYRAWRGLGVWHRNPRDDLRASFRNRGRGAPELTGEHNGLIITGSPEHVDVDRGACQESGAKGQFSEHTQGETHVPIVAEEPNLEVLGITAVALGTESNTLSFRWAMGGRVYTKTGDGYYYDLEGVR
jgi:hypothetical protein